MLTYLLQRLAAMVGVLFGISIIVFALVVAAPGDPAAILLEIEKGGVTPTAEELALFRSQLGLDAPAPQRYLTWVGQALTGDLGRSYRSRQPIIRELAARLPATLQLTGVSLVLAIGIGLPLGIGSVVWRNRWLDLLVRLLVLVGGAIPSYVLALLLTLLFAVKLGWLPAFGSGTPRHIILPALALAGGTIAQLMRLTHASMVETLQQDYVRTAQMKGVAPATVLLRHALRNGLLPIVTALGLSVGHLLSGAVIVETIFNWYGIGKYAVDAIFLRDYPVIQAVTLYMAVAFVLVNLLVDLLYRWIDPRVRLG